MTFAHGQSVTRLRATKTRDPYSGKQVASDWSAPDEVTLDDAWVASSSSTDTPSELRSTVTTSKSLYCAPDADVLVGDRIDTGENVYQVNTRPEADVNPFTGWRPVREVPLELVEG